MDIGRNSACIDHWSPPPRAAGEENLRISARGAPCFLSSFGWAPLALAEASITVFPWAKKEHHKMRGEERELPFMMSALEGGGRGPGKVDKLWEVA